MYSYQSEWLRTAFLFLVLILTLGILYGPNIMPSTYKTEFGNGIVIYADDYVSSGKWVFDCQYSRLISRIPLPPPIAELEQADRIIFGNMYTLSKDDEERAKLAIRKVIATPDWHRNLRYLYSSLDESSRLNTHVYDLLTNHENRQWALRVRQSLDHQGVSSFKVTAQPYEPDTYIDYNRALSIAKKSCPAPQ